MINNLYYLNELGRRDNLEDCIFPKVAEISKEDRVFLVCDGVGGEAGGEIASSIVCETLGTELKKNKNHTIDTIHSAANSAIFNLKEYVKMNPDSVRMSTTVSIACLDESGIWVGWSGDSRIYHIRNSRILWRSKDHSLVQMLVNIGEITEEEASKHEKRNIITRSFNASIEYSNLEIYRISEFKTGDYLLLCTDGLLENITDEKLCQLLNNQNDKENKAKLFNYFCEGITLDNYSMILLHLESKRKSILFKNIRILLNQLIE